MEAKWEPDGWGSRARIGLLTPHNDIVPENEFAAMAPSGVSIHVSRVDDLLARLRAHGPELIGEVAQYEDKYRLVYIRGPEGIIVALAQQLR